MMTRRNSTNDSVVDDAIRRVRKGNTAAFEVVVRQFERPLRAWLAVQTPPGIDVDEVAQMSFVAAFTRLGDYELGTNFAAWLFTIARFRLKTEVSRLRRVADYHVRYAPDLLQRELQQRDSEPPQLQETRLEHLQTCLGGLGADLYRFIKWRYVEEIPLEEMADRSGRSVAAVKKQLWKLRRKLHACVEARMAAEGEPS
jgi:RNA polymerase sigma-70 factor (ECF subfamily)